MRFTKAMGLGAVLAAASAVMGCGTAQIDQGQSVVLQPNQGIAAVVIDSTDSLTDIQFHSQDNPDNQIRIPNLKNQGINVFLFAVPAGTYCDAVFHYGSWKFMPTSRENARCFDVLPGRIAYSGNLSPRAFGEQDVRLVQIFTWEQFEKQMKRDYPELISKYPIVTP